jgi:hypothetical protein
MTFITGTTTRLNETRFGPKKSRPQYISAQNISTLFDALDEREIGIIHRFSRLVMLFLNMFIIKLFSYDFKTYTFILHILVN